MGEILSTEQMAKADKITIQRGMSELNLIQNAGKAMAKEIIKRFDKIRLIHEQKYSKRELNTINNNIVVCCGGGNNGADGYVCATELALAGFPTQIISTVAAKKLDGERKQVADKAKSIIGKIYYEPSPQQARKVLSGSLLTVEAILGTGLNKPPRDYTSSIIDEINSCKAFIVAADIPGGLSVDMAEALGESFIMADMTVTFFRPKPVHYLYPGASFCGEVVCVPIGIEDDILNELDCRYMLNHDKLLQLPNYYKKQRGAYKLHKYSRGKLLVVAGEKHQGAAVLTAKAAAAAGAGLVSVYASEDNAPLMSQLLGSNIIVHSNQHNRGRGDLMADSLEEVAEKYKVKAAIIGPGSGVNYRCAAQTLQLLNQNIPLVLDADVFSSFSENPRILLKECKKRAQKYHIPALLTPHEGEFARIFPHLSKEHNMKLPPTKNKIQRAIQAARESNSVIVLKGMDTVIANADGKAVVNSGASPLLSVGGSGDVLAGIIASLLAQGMSAYEGAYCGVKLHTKCAEQCSLMYKNGFLAQDLYQVLPSLRYSLSD